MILNKLNVFNTVYLSGSTSRAADQLNVTRSAISQSISKLEAELGTSLFTRLPKGLVPTQAAHQMAKNISPLLEQITNEVNAVRGNQISNSGTIHIGAPPVTGTFYLPRIIEAFNRENPNVEIKLSFDYSIDLINKVLTGELDLSIIDVFGGVHLQRDFHAFCHREPLLNEIVVMVCSPEYFSTHIGDDLSYENLSKQNFLSIREDFLEVKSWFLHQYNQSPTYLRKTLFSKNGLAALDCVCRGLGLFIVGSNVAKNYIEQGKLVEVKPYSRGEDNQLSLIQLLDKKPTQVEKAFIKHIKTYAKSEWENGL
ncbi:MAG: LysR family transcriptional regulator [Motiliproteus sp.]